MDIEKIKIKCPVCGKYKYGGSAKKNNESYIQCKNCLSIINATKLLKRLNKDN